ncbi:hypothetical protein FXO38_17095 [Capsicum annuum]|nr:hypothetical protein FXO38_17095 [Capsicum annuum]
MENNGQESVIRVQNPKDLAQIVTEGMSLGLEAYGRFHWFVHPQPIPNPFEALTSNVDLLNLNSLMMSGLSFYPQPALEEEVIPWIQKYVTIAVVEPPQPTVEQQFLAQDPIFVPTDLVDDMQEAGTMTSTHLGQVRVLLLKENHARKINVNCPQNMFKCSIYVRPTMNPIVGKYVVIMSPSLRERDQDSEFACRANAQYRLYKPMNFIIWNCRGSISRDFRAAFKELISNHKPTLVVLL